MLRRPNRLQWDGAPGLYEVYYLTLTDPVTGVGFWIRYSVLAPLAEADHATAALWFSGHGPAAGSVEDAAWELRWAPSARSYEHVHPLLRRARVAQTTLVLTNSSTFALTGWRFEAVDRRRKLIGEVDAVRAQLAGVRYADPDGELAHCYNSETASMRLHVYERARQVGGWAHRRTLVADGRTHFEYGQRAPVAGLELLTS